MSNYEMSIIGVYCPYCNMTTPVPASMTWYRWKEKHTCLGKASWHCVHCGEKMNVNAKRHIVDVEVTND